MIQQHWQQRCGMYTMYFISLVWCGTLFHLDFLPRTLETPMMNGPRTTQEVVEDANFADREERVETACIPPASTGKITTKPATGFNLTCPCNAPANLPAGIREVKLFYHVGMTNNWKEIMEDQLTTLDKCGLGHYASSLTISHTNGEPEQLINVLNNFSTFDANTGRVNVTLLRGPASAPWEARSINAIYDACHDAADTALDWVQGENSTKDETHTRGDVVVFYFHNKGVSKYSSTWKEELEQERTYSRSLYWRKYMEYFTLERPGLCLNAFADGAYTCGVELESFPNYHYSGNFWSASCDYIVKSKETMIRMDVLRNNAYLSAESGFKTETRGRHVSLFNRQWGLYKHLVLPKEYAIKNEAKALKIASSISIMSLYEPYDSVLRSLLDPVTSDSYPRNG